MPPSSARFGDVYPLHRLRVLSSIQQSFSDGYPVQFHVAGKLTHGHPVGTRATSVRLHLPQCFLQVLSLTYFLHESIRAGWTFGSMRRRERFGRFLSRFRGFTPGRGREVQFHLEVLPPVVPEIHGLLATPRVRAFSVAGYYALC